MGELGSDDLPPMLHIHHRDQRPPAGGGRSEPGTLLLFTGPHSECLELSEQPGYRIGPDYCFMLPSSLSK